MIITVPRFLFCAGLRIRITLLRIRISDPALHFNADLGRDPAFHFNEDPYSDPDPPPRQGSGSAWIRINLSSWIRIRIRTQIADPDLDPGGKK